MMNFTLYLNGVYEQVLEEIQNAQAGNPGLVCYLQPYSARAMARLAESPPTPQAALTTFISLTSSLSFISYQAKIIGWENKSEMASARRAELNAHMQKHQPSEEIYTEVDGKTCINLISVVDVEQLEEQIPVSKLVKISDQTPLKPRSTSGGWSYVKVVSD